MAQTKAQLVVGLNVNASAPASALQIDASGNVNLDSNTLYVDATNNRVGIGTSSPSELLTLNSSGTTGTAFRLENTSAGGYNWGIYSVGSAASLGPVGSLAFRDSTNGATRLVIDSSGRVGIGTQSPGGIFHTVTSGDNVNFFERTSGAKFGIYNSAVNSYIGTFSNHDLRLATNDQERCRIDTSGRLLVGTSSARDKFFGALPLKVQIEGSETNDCSLAITRNDATADSSKLILAHARGTSYQILSNNDAIGDISWQAADGNKFLQGAHIRAFVDNTPGVDDMPTRLVFSTTADGASAPTERMRITSTGYVGFNTSSFTSNGQLATNQGSNYYNFGANNSNAFIVYNSAGTGVYLVGGNTAWSANSDERLKTGLKPITEAAQKISTLRAVTGRYKTDDDTVSRAFLIAQDVQAVLPEAVNVQQDSDGILGLQYTDVIPLLVAAIKEQQIMITNLQSEVASLKAQ